MKRIGGNLQALLQVKDKGSKNAIGERVNDWDNVTVLTGWLDLSSGDSNYTNFNTKIQESTHIFLCDYIELKDVTSANLQMIINDLVYDVLLVDNPMNMNDHLEIYLRFVGGQK